MPTHPPNVLTEAQRRFLARCPQAPREGDSIIAATATSSIAAAAGGAVLGTIIGGPAGAVVGGIVGGLVGGSTSAYRSIQERKSIMDGLKESTEP